MPRRRIWLFLLLTFVVTPSATPQENPTPSPEQIEQSKRYVQATLAPDSPEFWASINDIHVALAATHRLGEPLSPHALHCLERLLPTTKPDDLARTQAAALLYRYGHKTARTILLQQVAKHQDENAANVLAMSKDPEAVTPIIHLLRSTPDLESHELTLLLGKWKNPRIAQGLLSAFKRAPENANMAIALSHQYLKAAKPLIEQLYQQTPADDLARPQITAALINIEARENPHRSQLLLSRLVNQLKAKESRFAHLRIVDALGLIPNPASQKALQQIIRTYLVWGTKKARSNPGGTIDQSTNDQLAVEAAQYLVPSPDNMSLTEKLLIRLRNDKLEDPARTQVAPLLARTTNPRTQKILIEIMGEKWLQKQDTISHLKPLPAHLLPPVTR